MRGIEMKEILELWFQLVKTQNILEIFLNKTSSETLSEVELRHCEEKGLQAIRNRFPGWNIRRK